MNIRTLVVDDEDLARAALRCALDSAPGIELVGEAVNGVDALEKIAELQTDLVLLDIEMPGLRNPEFSFAATAALIAASV